MHLMPEDELNKFGEGLIQGEFKTADGKVDKKKLSDSVLDLLIMAYVFGRDDVNEMLMTDIPQSYNDMYASIYKNVAGKNFEQRISEYADKYDTANEKESIDNILRVADTDMHRVYSEASYETAVKGGAKTKTWNTMGDDRVRDPHWILGGETLPIDADFYTEGASAPYPSAFGVPELDINCRCWLTYKK